MIRFICFVACEEKKKERIDFVFSHVFSSFLFFFIAAYSFFFFSLMPVFFVVGVNMSCLRWDVVRASFLLFEARVFFFFKCCLWRALRGTMSCVYKAQNKCRWCTERSAGVFFFLLFFFSVASEELYFRWNKRRKKRMTKNWRKESNIRNSGCACFSNTLYRYMKQLIRFFFFSLFLLLEIRNDDFFFCCIQHCTAMLLDVASRFFPPLLSNMPVNIRRRFAAIGL